MLKAEFVNPFFEAAITVLEHEIGHKPTRGQMFLADSRLQSDEVTVLIGVTGQVKGVVMYALSERTAKAFAGAMTGKVIPVYDAMVESAISETGNVITGRASGLLEKAGYRCTISPPTVINGRGLMISTIAIQRLVIPLSTHFGDIAIHIALQEDLVSQG